jgi:D-glycero-alpha-D-manno-heptose-7-phosphate kinase
MIVVRAPFRASFLGGGSDIPHFFKVHGGAVVSSAINRHMFITGRKMYHRSESLLKYSSTELVKSYSQIKHPIFREVFKKFSLEGLDIGVSSDIPSGSGLGSSSTFTVALIALVGKLQELGLTRMEIAELACEIEIDLLKEPIGKQDQFASAFGGMNLFIFQKSGSVIVEPYQLSISELDWLSNSLFLVEVPGVGRSASQMLGRVYEHISQNQSALIATKDLADLAIQGFRQMQQSGIKALPTLLNEAWRLKKLSTPEALLNSADEVMRVGISSGALAGKLLGAGGGGFILFIVEPADREQFLGKFSDRHVLQVRPDLSGVKVIYEEEDK